MQETLARTLIYFQSGEWDQAHAAANHQLGLTLDELQAPYWEQAFALAALVPAARGEVGVTERYLGWQGPRSDISLSRACQHLVGVWAQVSARGVGPDLLTLLDPLWSTGLVRYVSGHPLTVLRVGAHLAAGQHTEAERALQDLEGVPYDSTILDYTRAHCSALLASANGDAVASRAWLTSARDHLDRHDATNPTAPLALFRVLLAEDQARLVGATDDIDGALRTLQRCGATAWRERLATLLDAPTSDADLLSLLTTREREIALLVAKGLTNRQIAERLFVTTRTAEYHVHNALTKLGMNSRAQLRTALDRPPAD